MQLKLQLQLVDKMSLKSELVKNNENRNNVNKTTNKRKNNLTKREELLMRPIKNFFSEKKNIDTFFNILKGENEDSLRLYEWFVVNYSKKYDTRYHIINKNGEKEEVIVYLDYKSQLQSYSKKYFDAFCRTKRIYITNFNGEKEETTVGQLNFFKWAISKKIIDYIKNNRDDISKDMIISLRHLYNNKDKNKKNKRRTRKELSVSATKKINKHNVKIVVSFD